MSALFSDRAFVSLFATQFLAAFNDNLFKNLLVMWLTFSASINNPGVWVTAAAGIFVLPFVLFSPLAGQLADKWPRHVLIRVTQTAEVAIMGLAMIGFGLNSPWLLLLALFLMGLQSTLFGPVKYSILPHFFSGARLLAVNSWWSGGTFVAIVLGTLVGTGGWLLDGAPVALLMGVSLVFSLLGAWSAWRVPPAPAAQPALKLRWHLFAALWESLRWARRHAAWGVMLAISGFWMVGAMILSQIPLMASALGSPRHTVWLLLLFVIGIGLGALLAWWWNRKTLHLEWTARWYGLMALWLSVLLWAWPDQPVLWWPAFFLLAVTGGVMVVPLYVWLQRSVEDGFRGRLFAALNVLNALFMVAGTGSLMIWHLLGL